MIIPSVVVCVGLVYEYVMEGSYLIYVYAGIHQGSDSDAPEYRGCFVTYP